MNRDGTMIGALVIGDNQLSLASHGKTILGVLNGSLLTESSSASVFEKKASPVLSMVTAELGKGKPLRVWGDESGQNMIRTILKCIKDYPEEVKLLSLETKPDEIEINSPPTVQASGLMELLGEYRKQVRQIAASMEETRSLAGSLLRTELPRTMWGANKIHGTLRHVQGDMDTIETDLNRFDISIERTDKSADMFRDFMPAGRLKGESAAKLADNVIEDFHCMKQAMSKTSQALYALFNIDPLCKKYTGYPTTWFFDSSIYYDFLYEFENLIRNLIKTTRTEQVVMAPLSSWKHRMLGEPRCQTT